MDIVPQLLITMDVIRNYNGVVSSEDNADTKQSFNI